MGQVLRNEGKYPEAMEVIQKGIESLMGDQPKERGALQIAMASALTRQGELESAQEWCKEGMENVETGGDLAELAHVYSLLGTIRRDLGDTEASLTYRKKSLEISEDIANIPLQMEAHNNLAVAYYDLGQLQEAVSHYEQSRELSERMGNLNTTARAEINLGEVQLIRGDWEEAERAFRQALRIWESTGYRLGQAYGSCNMGTVLTRKGEAEEALEYLENSEEVFSEMGAQSFMPIVHRRQAAAHLALGDLARAEILSQQALNLAKKLSMRQEEGAALRILGVIYRKKGDQSQAAEKLERSVKIFHEAGIQYEEARSILALSRVWYEDMQYARIQPALDGAIENFKAVGADVDLRQAKELKARTATQYEE
jgi:tetratricopeptide (TPR) repeat protein